ncbi:glycine receptor subunit alpha-4-like [Schistocerca nitens]|uniref:glycine receptor subunit alpha-4-like n=1 Tax=Schistocerca nitens TaxID=7011 RepID=UPI00211944EC|nr:glycine receptor subunit alpha-4-like [Schistocerca nitens]
MLTNSMTHVTPSNKRPYRNSTVRSNHNRRRVQAQQWDAAGGERERTLDLTGETTEVSVSLFINRISAVDENKEEISLDVFLYVHWRDPRVHIRNDTDVNHVELTWKHRERFWVPDLYIRQLREMKVLSLFQEMTSLRLFRNHTMRISIGATVIIKCDMDFVLYPLDVQRCDVDFSSYKYTIADMNFKWVGEKALSFPSDFGDGYRLPKYVVSFSTEDYSQGVYYGEGNHSTARMHITMSRELRSYLLETYLPSSLFVIMSWGSFVVIPDMVPGRMVLLVTTLLSLVTMFDTVRNNSPPALELKCIEVWLISCTLFVFFALIEYFVVLFGIRYDKHWRQKKRDTERAAPPPLGTQQKENFVQRQVLCWQGQQNSSAMPRRNQLQAPAPSAAASNHNHVSPVAPIRHMSQLPPLLRRGIGKLAGAKEAGTATGPGGGSGGVGSSRIDNLRLFGGTSKVAPQHLDVDASKDIVLPSRTVLRENHVLSSEHSELRGRLKFRAVAEYVVLYCGSQRGMVDQVSLVLFPVCFFLFTTVYWISYVSESRMRMNG